MASALVLGSSGMVGRAVSARLRELGVRVVDANRTGAGGAIVVDAANPPPAESLIAGADLVVNAIGVLRSHQDYPGTAYRLHAARVNTVFPLLLAQAAERHGVRVVHVSTDAVFGPGNEPADERTIISPSEPYGLSKALGEAESEHVLNIRCSVVGPAPGRVGGLWEWFATQPRGAVVEGFNVRWTGATSRQLAVLCGDFLDPPVFDRIRATGPTQHFLPNEPLTKRELLSRLSDALRPDITVVGSAHTRGNRELVSSTGALDAAYSGVRGWNAAIADVLA
jgi:dTDP-4-dehydrorhamnose reductase